MEIDEEEGHGIKTEHEKCRSVLRTPGKVRESGEKRRGGVQGSGAEESQAQAQDVEGQDPLGPPGEKASRRRRSRTGAGLGLCREKEALNGQNNSVNGAENDVGPIGAVPEAGENHGHKKILNGFPLTGPAAAHGDIQVIAKPAAQADVPAAPEVL